MSVIPDKTWKTVARPVAPASSERTPIVVAAMAAVRLVGGATVLAAGMIRHGLKIINATRMQRMMIEAQLYRNLHKHTNKNDDDLPVIH